MKAHRHYSPKTIIILILTSVFSFAFIACNNAGLECIKSDGYDREDCEKGCFNDNGKYREDTCNKLCDRYRKDGSLYYGSIDNDKKDLYLRACSISCSLPNCYDLLDCVYACRDGKDAAACERYKENYPDRYACDINGDTAACENEKKKSEEFRAALEEERERAEKAQGPAIASTDALGTMGTKAADQAVILVGRVDEIGDGRDFLKGVFIFHPHSSNLTKDSSIIACDLRSDVRARNVNVGDVITISGFAKTNANKRYIVISNCQFHGSGDRSNEVLVNKEYL